ncbi:protein LAZ1 homolog 2-like [Pistacia vera]|uniref:protein LAZ1 homolog 2-like n=1 Tax=Pistacia vera TaxID=55513 RepID=UPI001262FD23|nr:protein LAZ1 homolog 2-like [Pistacia vera]XP_031274046.1 protein LAZ1 homolog 2-like [Pistacia vera]
MMATSNVVLVHEENTYRNLHQPAVIIGGCFALAAVILSLFLILQHLRSYTNPAEQKWIVAVLFIVPVYASESILSLWKPRFSLACDILRNCYEAFALYSFGSYLIACLGGERRTIEFLESKSRKQLSKPLLAEENQVSQKGWFSNFFFRPCDLGKDLFSIQKLGLVQYMILKTLCAFLALVLELCGVYGDGEFKWYCGYPYIAVVLNFSQMWALYCLVNFYNVTHERLRPIKPLAKFISFKAIVFATWWQGVGIALLCALGVLPNKGKLKNGLQDFLICIEMAIAAVAHMFVFSAEFYHYLPAPEPGKLTTRRTEERLKLEEKDKKPAMLEKTKIQIEAPGTSISESVQDIVVEGGQRVVEDVVLTINQAMGPVEKGVTKIQEKLHSKSLSSDDKEGEWEFKVEEHVEENLTGTKNFA